MKSYRVVREMKPVDEKILDRISCNRCGKEIPFDEKDGQLVNHTKKETVQEINIEFGYGSAYDGEKWTFDLCEDCLTDFVKSFKVLPEGYGLDPYNFEYPTIPFEELDEPEIKETPEKE